MKDTSITLPLFPPDSTSPTHQTGSTACFAGGQGSDSAAALYDRPWTVKPGNNMISRGQSSNHTHYDCLIDVFVVVRSHSARVQKTSYENYAPGYVPARESFRRQGGVRGSGAARKPQNQPPTRQIFVEREASRHLSC